jgi:CheY-like chemotaxis protein
MKPAKVVILLVEDDDIDAEAVTRGLAEAKIGNPLIRARDGAEALEMLCGTNGRQKMRPPYLLLVDINMPKIDGLELVRRIRSDRALQRTIIFMLTTSDSDRDLTAAYNAHVAGYIVKTNGADRFSKLARMLEYYLEIVAPPTAELCEAL